MGCGNCRGDRLVVAPAISVGAKHSGKQIIAEKISLIPECFALPWFSNLKTAVGRSIRVIIFTVKTQD